MMRLFRRRRQFRVARCGCGFALVAGTWIRLDWCLRHDPLFDHPELFEFTPGDC